MITMKWVLVSLLLVSPTSANGQGVPPSTGQANHTNDEQVIGHLNLQWLNAYDAGDVAALDRIENDDFTVASDFGEVTKQQQLEEVRHRSGKPEASSRRVDNQQFRFYGDVALVTEVDRNTSAEGTSVFQSTTLWVRRGGVWRVVHLHYSSLPKKKP